MFHGENNLSPEWHVDKFGWMGNRFLFLLASLSPAKLPKSAREILVWEFGGINLCINSFPARIYQLSGEKNLPHHIGQKLLPIFSTSFVFFIAREFKCFSRSLKNSREFSGIEIPREKESFSVSISWMGINFESRWESYLESFIFIQTRKKTK